jgi:hypothetical protein
MNPILCMTFYAVFGGLASAAGLMTLYWAPEYWFCGLFGTVMGFYGFFQAWRCCEKKR